MAPEIEQNYVYTMGFVYKINGIFDFQTIPYSNM